jgi:TonB-linked SusC/RagA family outer membrane protein
MRNSTFLKSCFTVLFTLILFSLWAQQSTLRGTVTDNNGVPLQSVTVRVKGTNTTALTDEKGSFSINAPSGSTLVFSYLGQEKEQRVTSDAPVAISFDQGRNLTEVVVVALGQSRSKQKVGYSTTTINSEALNRTAPTSAVEALAARVPGADISKTGGPGSSTKVVLRGYGIIAGGNNQPLYVIDGVPATEARFGSINGNLDFGNSAGDINPNDIENISVLRGTAATSLYGSQARNGAILITTKRGKAGKLKVEYAGSANFSRVGKLPEYQSIFGQGWNGVFILSENGSWGPKLDGRDRLWGATVDNSQLIKPFSFVKNNLRDFYDIGTEYNNTISLSGGNDITSFYFSYGNVTSDGVIPTNTDFYGRNTFALRTNSKFDRFTINSSFNYINKRVDAPFTGQPGSDGGSTFEDILQIPVDIPIKDLRDYKNKFFNVDNYFTPYAENPWFEIYENRSKQNSDRFFGNIDLGYKFTNTLSAQLRLGGDFTNARTFGYKAVNAPKPGSWNAGNNVEGQARPADVGSVTEATNYGGTINGDFIVKYANNSLTKDFSFEALGGVNYYQQEFRGLTSVVTNLVVPGFYNLSNSKDKPTSADASNRKRTMGVYAQTVLGFRDYVYLTLNARNDWSSTLPLENNHFFYPGANISWIASNTFNLDRTKISLLKLRAAYGQTGADPVPYVVYPVLNPGVTNLPFGNITFPFNGVNSYRIANALSNAELKPIITTEAEVGAEMRFFANRLGFDLSVYDKRTKGQIFNVPVDPASGYTALTKNLGTIQNKGIELALDGKPVVGKNFNWQVGYTFSKNVNKVLELNGGSVPTLLANFYDVDMLVYPGKSVTGLYAPVPQYTEDGKVIVNPTTGVPLIADDKGYYGDAQNDFTMGLSNTLSYKNWSLNFVLDYRKGGVMYSGTADLILFTGNGYATTYNDRRPFIIPNSVYQDGVDASGKPVYKENTTPITETGYDAYWYPTSNLAMAYKDRIFDRSFMKLRDASLTFRLPQQWSSKISAQGISLTAYARNILLWTPKENIYIDPEANNNGNDLGSQIGEFRTAPVSQQYGIALKVNF